MSSTAVTMIVLVVIGVAYAITVSVWDRARARRIQRDLRSSHSPRRPQR